MDLVSSVLSYISPPPIDTVTLHSEILPCNSFADAVNLANERKKNVYAFAKPFFQFVPKEAECFKWSVFCKQCAFVKIEKGTAPPFYPLIAAVRQVADGSISDYLRVKLNKLMLVLYETAAWPFEKVTAQAAAQAFINFKNLKEPDHQDVEKLSHFVRQLNKGLRERSMSLQTIAEKIATKANRPLSGGKNLYGRIKELVQLGIKRIEKDFKADPTLLFCRVFAMHTSIFQENRDNLGAQADLKKCVNQLVRVLRKSGDSTLLRQFFSELLGKIEKCRSIKWMVQALAADPDFIFYMQQNNLTEEIRQNLLKLVKCDAAIDALVFLGDEKLFTDFIDQNLLTLTKAEFGQIFIRLNEILPENVKMYKNQYLYFLTKLRFVNKLFLLASFTENSELIKQNLSALDIYHKEPLSSFFGNAAFKVLTMPEFSDLKMKDACFKLFLHSGRNPIENEAKFHGFLSTIHREFKDGYSELCDLVFTKMGEEKIYAALFQSHPVDAVAYLQRVIDDYQTIKKFVLTSLPIAWKTKKEDLENDYKIFTVQHNHFYLLQKNFLIPFKDEQVIGNSSGDCFYGEEIDTLKRRIKEELNQPAHREAILSLTEAYLLSTNRYRPALFTEMIQCTNPQFEARIKYLTDYFTGKIATIPKN